MAAGFDKMGMAECPVAERKTESRSPDVPCAWRDGGGTAADLRFVMASHKPG